MVKPVGVPIPDGVDPTSPQIFEAFEAKLEELNKAGSPVRAVIMTNPNNPLGFIYPKETILAYCRFCEKHNLHL
jgi:aspartate/methionine/tyrosine aminotransferase